MIDQSYISFQRTLTDMDLISTRSIWLHPCTFLDATGESGGLLLNIGLISKWFSLLLSHFLDSFNTYARVEPVESRLYLSRTLLFGKITEKE